MKKTTLILIVFCLFGVITESKACSPARTSFVEWLNRYNQSDYIIVEGYFQPVVEKRYATKFKITRSSDSSIKKGKEYEVFEYGPFGNTCETYEMQSAIDSKLTGKNNPRLLILYKKRSVNGKLVTPIFWDAGVDASNNKIVSEKYDSASRDYVSYECSTSLDGIWKQILTGSMALEWKKEAKNTKKN